MNNLTRDKIHNDFDTQHPVPKMQCRVPNLQQLSTLTKFCDDKLTIRIHAIIRDYKVKVWLDIFAVKNICVPLTLFHMIGFINSFWCFQYNLHSKFWCNFMWFWNFFLSMQIFSRIWYLTSSFAWFCLWTAKFCLLLKVWQIEFIAILILKYIYNFI